ncbi:hypothetical protein BDP27DRAFT_1441275 [Rhodocollybia butyracea]|uniref:Uncharacterized protein n=1 Tax=Rhodocollybia butyracea TaxID=206335 RepID=A0A9P5Q9Q3_9AGAR|nr:hypothetical protein BDP27DRAFT_1441275 [Rhodocollybia butyracea]
MIYLASAFKWETIRTEGIRPDWKRLIHLSETIPGHLGYSHTKPFVVIHIDFQKARLDGLTFFRAPNGDIVSDGGQNRCISPACFTKIERIEWSKDLIWTSQEHRQDE